MRNVFTMVGVRYGDVIATKQQLELASIQLTSAPGASIHLVIHIMDSYVEGAEIV